MTLKHIEQRLEEAWQKFLATDADDKFRVDGVSREIDLLLRQYEIAARIVASCACAQYHN